MSSSPNTEEVLGVECHAGPFELAGPPETRSSQVPTRQTRLVELVLVLGIAFSPSIFHSFASIQKELPAPSGEGFVYGISSQLISLAVLIYILQRQGRSLREIGPGFSLRDLPVSVVLFGVGYCSWRFSYWVLAYFYKEIVGSIYHPKAVSAALFGVGLSVSSLIYTMVNPFKEELLARAYLMTEVNFITGSVWISVVVSVLFQTSYHFYQGVIPAISFIATFSLFAFYFAKTKRIMPIILAHLFLDLMAWTLHAMS